MKRILYTAFSGDQTIAPQLQRWRDESPQCGVFALVAEQSAEEVPGLQALFRELGIPLLGAIFPEIHLAGRFYRRGALLVSMDPRWEFQSMVEFEADDEKLASQIESLASTLRGHLSEREPATLFTIFDALVPKIGSILETLYLQLAESVHYTGASAGSETFQPMPCLFDAERLIGNGLLVMLLKPHEGAMLDHSYQVPEEIIAATSTEGNRINSIDWRPAFEVYRERVRQLYGVEIDRHNFYDYSVHFPFGILRADDEVVVRIPVSLEEDGSIFCVGEVPEHAVLTLLEAPRPTDLHSAGRLARGMRERGGRVLNFYCAARKHHFGEAAAVSELQELHSALGHEELFGASSLGEIGSSQRGGYPLFHHATLVCMHI